MRPTQRDAPSTGLADRAAALLGLGLLAWLTPNLLARAGAGGSALQVATAVVCGLSGLALLPALLLARGPGSLAALLGAARRRPLASALLLFDGALLGLSALVVLREWGLLLCLALAAGAWARISLSAAAVRGELVKRLVPGAALGASLLLLGLGAGELWLRAHPEQVGGGGGGNPALSVLHAGLYEYNALDLRGPLPQPAPDLRVLALGDSFTFGQGVAEPHTWPAQLQGLLDARAPGRRHEVINAGRPGLDTRGELAWLRDSGAELQPDLVIVQFYVNDVVQPASEDPGSQPPWSARLLAGARRRAWVLFHLQHRVAAWQLRARASPQAQPGWLGVFARHVERADAAWRACAEALDALAAWSRERDTPLLLVLYPHPGAPYPGTTTIHAAVAQQAEGAGLQVLDLAPLVLELPPERQVAAAFDHHPSPELHGLAAAAILTALEQLGWLP